MSDMVDLRIAWIQQFESGKIWYNKLVSIETKRTYLRNLERYCKVVKKNPDELIELKMEGQKNIGSLKEYAAETLLESFFSGNKLADSVKMAVKDAVMSFYYHNRRSLESSTASNVVAPEHKQRSPSTNDVIDLENVMTTARDKFLVWFCATTAFRLSTIPQLKWEDLQSTNDKDIPYQLIIESARLKGKGVGKYRGLKQVAFLNLFVVQKLKAYEKEISRKGYTITPESPLFIKYDKNDKVLGLTDKRIELIFTDASLAAWNNLEKKRFSPHDFRDFLQSKLESAGLNSNMISPFLAHKVKGTDAHYSNHQIEELREKFKTALPYLLPQTVEQVKAETDIRFSQLEGDLAKAREELAILQPLTILFSDKAQIEQFSKIMKMVKLNEEVDTPEIVDTWIRGAAKESGKTEKEFIDDFFDKKTKRT